MSNDSKNISSIYFKEKNETSESESETYEKNQSCSLPSLPASLQNQLDSPEKNLKISQAMTMKEIDCKLNSLRRENFDLKLRLYLEKKNKGFVKPEGEALISKEFAKKEKALKACKKNLLEKDKKIANLKTKLEELEKNKEFEICLLTNENQTLVDNLSVASKICKTFASHLCEIKDFWSQFLNDSKNHKNINLINSLSQWFNTSQNVINNASVIISDENTISKIALHDISSKFKGMSSLGLLPNFSEIFKEEKELKTPFDIKLNHSAQTEIDNEWIKDLINQHQKIANILMTDADTQTIFYELEQKKMIENFSQTILPDLCEKKVQTKWKVKETFAQTCNLNQEATTQTEIKESTDIGTRSLTYTVDSIGPSPVLRSKNVSKSAVLKKLNNVQLLNSKSSTEEVIALENNKSVKKNSGIFKIPSEKVYSKVKKSHLLKVKNQGQKENELAWCLKKKIQLDKSFSINSAELCPKNDSIIKISNKENKMIDLKKKQLDDTFENQIENFHFTILNLEHQVPPYDLNSSLRAYIKLSYYQLLRKNLNFISSNFNSIENLTNERFVLNIIKDNEYLEKFKSFLSVLQQTMLSSKKICNHFSIEDENSILAKFEKIKAKKIIMEKAITRQLRKTDILLKKAKINLKE